MKRDQCQLDAERAVRAAKQLYVAQMSTSAELDRYTTDLAEALFTAPDGVTATVESATNTTFLARVKFAGHEVAIDESARVAVAHDRCSWARP